MKKSIALSTLLLTACVVQAGDKPLSNGSANGSARAVSGSGSSTAGESLKPGLHVQFSLNRPTGGRYRRPYVAVWLEDEENFPIKTGLLWLQTENPGPRWHRDLTRWYRNDRMRKLAERTDLIDGISGATRGPGDYQVHFDGTDNDGNPLKPGKYTLYLEIAREHGTYQIAKKDIVWGDAAIEPFSIPDNVEFSDVMVSYVPTGESSE